CRNGCRDSANLVVYACAHNWDQRATFGTRGSGETRCHGRAHRHHRPRATSRSAGSPRRGAARHRSADLVRGARAPEANRNVAPARISRCVVGCAHRPRPPGVARVTLALDTSALLAIAVDGPQREVVLDALRADPLWCASAMALTEALPAIDRLTDEPVLRADLEDAIRLAWDHLHVVPIDQRCLDRAAN